MKLLLAAIIHSMASKKGAPYDVVADEENPGNWIVWDNEYDQPIYDEDKHNEAIALSALMNMGLPYQFSAIEGIMEEAGSIRNDEHVQLVFNNIREYEAENAKEQGNA